MMVGCKWCFHRLQIRCYPHISHRDLTWGLFVSQWGEMSQAKRGVGMKYLMRRKLKLIQFSSFSSLLHTTHDYPTLYAIAVSSLLHPLNGQSTEENSKQQSTLPRMKGKKQADISNTRIPLSTTTLRLFFGKVNSKTNHHLESSTGVGMKNGGVVIYARGYRCVYYLQVNDGVLEGRNGAFFDADTLLLSRSPSSFACIPFLPLPRSSSSSSSSQAKSIAAIMYNAGVCQAF